MFDFGEELTIESHRIPWLIWIQILVLFLLIFLIYCFSVFTSDLSDATNNNSSSSSSSAPPNSYGPLFLPHNTQVDKRILLKQKQQHQQHNDTTSGLQHHPVTENQSIKSETAPSTGRRIVREDDKERNGSSLRDTTQIDYHPCSYFRIAKLAFLKCLGLDSTPEGSSSSQQKKER